MDVAKQIEALGLPRNGPPVAFLYNTHIRSNQLAMLYRGADAFVLPSRGEGWGMPILEAMACGLPVIATPWSGPSEFLHEDVRWADPDVDDLVARFRHVFTHREEARAKGAKAAEEAAAKWTWAHTAARVDERLREIGA